MCPMSNTYRLQLWISIRNLEFGILQKKQKLQSNEKTVRVYLISTERVEENWKREGGNKSSRNVVQTRSICKSIIVLGVKWHCTTRLAVSFKSKHALVLLLLLVFQFILLHKSKQIVDLMITQGLLNFLCLGKNKRTWEYRSIQSRKYWSSRCDSIIWGNGKKNNQSE